MHVPGHLSGDSCTELDAKVKALIIPSHEEEMVAPGAYCDTLPKVPQHVLASSQPVHTLFQMYA